jgi:prepilin-type N-terminal cleavage/methylation domain-containing protein
MKVKCWTFSRRRGLTLIEVVAGLALLSVLLVAVLTAKARATRQWINSARRLEATAAADRLLTRWWPDRAHFPRDAAGRVPGDSGLFWRTSTVRNDAVNSLVASVVRLEVLDGRTNPPVTLSSVEIVLDDAPQASTSGQLLTRGESP